MRPDPGNPPHQAGRSSAQVRAWCLYDWANSAFATTITAAVLPPFFAAAATRSMPAHLATARWGYASALAMLFAAVLGPVVGSAADRLGRRKPLLLACVLIGSLATIAMALVPGQEWRGLLAAFGVAFIAFATGNVLYDSLLPAVAAPGEMHRVSARGFAYGYFGGGLLLAINLAWILFPRRFGLADAEAASRLSFASVAVWWLLFSIPLFRRVPEPRREQEAAPARPGALALLRGVVETARGLPRHPERFRFLVAFWLYSDGIGTVIKMATVYGTEAGIGRADLIGALLMVQILAAPASLAFGRLARPLGPQRAVALGLAGYVGVTVLGFFLSKPIHFWALAALVAMVQGGTQALSRSMFASLVPRRQMGELFGFYSVSEKMAGVVGPLAFGLVAQWSGAGRFAVLTLLPFFVAGGWLLLTVDLERGARRAME
ncbi:MAG TPA: MFS transporter [Candidatus Eisenbacteria bacterium]